MTEYHIIGISGSLRKGSYNTALLRAAFEDLPQGITAEIAALEDLPMYNADVEREIGFSPPVAELRAAVAAADGIVFATPEYNFSVTGALKNAIDWLSRGPESPLDYKPAAIIGAGGRSGTRRSQDHLREILTHNALHVLADPEVLVPRASMHFDGTRLNSDAVRSDLRGMIDGLVRLIERHPGTDREVPRGSILVAGSDALIAAELARRVTERGYRTTSTTTAGDAVRIAGQRTIAAAVIDGNLDEQDRAAIVEALEARHPESPVIIVEDRARVGEAVDDELHFELAGR